MTGDDPERQSIEAFETGDLTVEEERRRRQAFDGPRQMEVEDGTLDADEYTAPVDHIELPVIDERRDSPRNTHNYAEEWERGLFEDLEGYDPARNQADIPGTLDFSIEDGQVHMNYSVQRRSDITQNSPDQPDGFSVFDLMVNSGDADFISESDYLEVDIDVGKEPYLTVEISYDEESNRGRKQALQTFDEIANVLGL